MTAIGGSITEDDLAGRGFPVAADAESQRKLGGFENEVLANGNGSARIIKTRIPAMIDGLTIECDDSRGDHEFLQNLADKDEYFSVVITYASGVSYQGTMIITGDLQVSSQSATAEISLSGQDKLSQQQ